MIASFRVSPLLKVVVASAILATLALSLLATVAAEGHDPGRPDIVDFNVFMLVGRMASTGTLDQAYRMATLAPLEHALSVQGSFMPWSYPPVFALLLAPLAALPLGVAFATFTGSTLLFYVAVLRRLAGPAFWTVLLATTPSVLINLRSGQNGLLTAALAGAATLSLLAARPSRSGAWIACLAIKPHLALTLPPLLVLERRWRTIAVAALGCAALAAGSVAVFGPGIVRGFLGGLGEAGSFLEHGRYPIQRMTSVFSFLLGLGASSQVAAWGHAAVVVALLVPTSRAMLRDPAPSARIGLALMSAAFVSPYLYDYDLTLFGIGLALLAQTLGAALPGRRYGLLLGLVASAQFVGVILGPLGSKLSLGAPLLLLAYAVVLVAMKRHSASLTVPDGRVVDRRSKAAIAHPGPSTAGAA